MSGRLALCQVLGAALGSEAWPCPRGATTQIKDPTLVVAGALESSVRESVMSVEKGTESGQSLLSGGRRGSLES